MDFIVDLLKEAGKGIMREGAAYIFRKQFLNEDNEKTTLDRGKLLGWFFYKKK
ncbi:MULTISPECIES: hypothetical protein [Bacillus cereus group]|uniref:hypothetical protein n=1 Tax=Bacillus cereus group TaxID=86661 RepID=UPI001642D59B|nr:hypothetical protein [Bacillus tropicus]